MWVLRSSRPIEFLVGDNASYDTVVVGAEVSMRSRRIFLSAFIVSQLAIKAVSWPYDPDF